MPCPSNHCLCPRSEKCFHKQKLCPKRKLQPVANGVPFWGLCPPKYCLCPPSVNKVSFQDKKTQVNARWRLYFWSPPLNLWTRTEIRTIRFHCSLQAINVPPQPFRPSKNCALNIGKWPGATGCDLGWRPFFFWSSLPNLREKFICAFQIFFLPPSSHATIAPGLLQKQRKSFYSCRQSISLSLSTLPAFPWGMQGQ